MDCIFCKIIAGDIPSAKVYEDDMVVAFKDINPQAPVHLLVIPKLHIPCADEITPDNAAVAAHIFAVIPKIAEEQGIKGKYRIINNCGAEAGQTVFHLHFHILGGCEFTESLI